MRTREKNFGYSLYKVWINHLSPALKEFFSAFRTFGHLYRGVLKAPCRQKLAFMCSSVWLSHLEINGKNFYLCFFHCCWKTTFKLHAARKKIPFTVPYRFPHRNPRLVPRPSKHFCYFSDYSSFILHQREALCTSPLSAFVQVLKRLQRRDLFVIGTSLKQSAGNGKCYTFTWCVHYFSIDSYYVSNFKGLLVLCS